MVIRKIIRIDEEKCTGCGVCIPTCVEGALKIVNGRAKLISDKYCDGLGACIGECPQGAINIEEREAEEFDKEAVKVYLKEKRSVPVIHSCPSTQAIHFVRNLEEKSRVDIQEKKRSMLSQWPIQLKLIPTNAPIFEDADLLVAADCVPFAYANFHNDFLKGRAIIIGCPKLDDGDFYKEKLTEIFKQSNIRTINVINMEVPCCFGLYHLVKQALNSSGKNVPLKQKIISIKGEKINASPQGHPITKLPAR